MTNLEQAIASVKIAKEWTRVEIREARAKGDPKKASRLVTQVLHLDGVLFRLTNEKDGHYTEADPE